MELGEDSKAKANFEQALAVAPDYGWPQMLLNQLN